MKWPWQGSRPPFKVPVRAGERVLSWCATRDGRVLAGTREAFYVAGPDSAARVPWEQVETARWEQEDETLRVEEVGTFGEPRPVHTFEVSEPGLLLQLVRERVTASILWQRHVPVVKRRGVRVIARRAPSGVGPVSWYYDFDRGIDPDDPEVRRVAEEALARAQEGLGDR